MTTHLRRFEPSLRRAAAAALALGLSLLLAALPALATEVVQVRVGRHPEFTRVVFELDAPARYRVEKHEGAHPELVVTIDAASTARTILSKSEGIKGVTVKSEGKTTVARVALRKPGLRLKEMILANPSRIVLDLMHDAPKVAVAKPPAPAPKPEPVKPELRPAPEPVAKQPEPAPAPVAKTPTPEPVKPPAPAPVAKTPVEVTPEPAPVAPPKPEPAPEVVAKAPGDEAVPEPAVAPAPAPKPVPPLAKTPTPKPKPQPVAKPRPATKSAKPESAASGPPIEILAGAAVGLLLCVVGLVVLLRRRRPGRDAGDDLAGDDGDGEQRSFTEMVFSESGGDSAAESSAGGSVSDLDSFFDDSDADGMPGSSGGKTMEQGLSDLPTDRGATRMSGMSGMGSSASSSPDPDVLRVVHELERRMGQLEGKLGEANEARERLERQVAAQSEELRVQRAAIARTQRALRSLSRGDDDKATEPALRDDDTQAKTRINV